MPAPLLAALAAYASISLATKGYRHRPYQLGATSLTPVDGKEDVKLAVLEFDDDGAPWCPSWPHPCRPPVSFAIDNVLRSLDKQIVEAKKDTVIVVFVHGWHHNAELNDSDFVAFRSFLGSLSDILQKKAHRTFCGTPQVLGVYLGWRGRSAWGFADYLTFFGREAAAERIGRKGAADFLLRLDRQVRTISTDKTGLECKKEDGTHRKASTALIIMGHSLGGAIVFSALENRLQSALAESDSRSQLAELGLPGSAAKVAPTSQASQRPESGVGDLTILINPAIDAQAYYHLKEHLQGPYSQHQNPILMVVASENDRVNQFWFGLAKWLPTIFHPQTEQSPALRTALGVLPEQWTHCLERRSGHHPKHCPNVPTTLAPPWAPPDSPSGSWTPPSNQVVKSVESIGLAGDFRLPNADENSSETLLYRTDSKKPDGDLNDPFLVVRTSRDILFGHSGTKTKTTEGLFEPNLVSFLLGYVSEAVTKRTLIYEACLNGAQPPLVACQP